MANSLDPTTLQNILAMRQGRGTASGGGQVWYDPTLQTDDPNAYMLQSYAGRRPDEARGYSAESGVEVADPSLDQNFITLLRPGTGGKLGDQWDTQGNYVGPVELNSGGGRDFNQGLLMAAPAVAGVVSAGGAAGASGGAAGLDAASLATSDIGIGAASAGGGGGGAVAAGGGAAGAAGSVSGAGGAAGGGMAGWGDWANLAANVGSSLLQSNASRDASRAQSDAAAAASQLQREQFDQTSQRNQPFVQGGTQAFNALLDRLGLTGNTTAEGYGTLGGTQTFDGGPAFTAPTADQVMAQPGYQFGLRQGQENLDRQAAARGTRYSGSALAQAARYGNDYATGRYGDEYNRLMGAQQQGFNQRLGTFNANQGARQQGFNQLAGVAGIGQASANNTAAAGQQFASTVGQNLMGAANAQGANSIAQGNIWGNALNQGISAWNQNQGRSSYSRPSGGGFGSGYGYGNQDLGENF